MRNKKYGSTIQITSELLEHMLGLPKGLNIVSAYMDGRDILHIKLRSASAIEGLSYETKEGAEYVSISDKAYELYRKTLTSNSEERESHD